MHRNLPLGLMVIAPVVGAFLNVIFNGLNRALGSPLFFDSIMTAIVAAVGGIPLGLATALLTQGGMEVLLSFQNAGGTALPFVFCGFATAGIVGAMVHWGWFSSLRHLVAAIVAVTLANAVIGGFTAALVFGGSTLHGSDFLVAGFMMGGQQLLDSAFWARIPLNLVDKGIAVALAFFTWQYYAKNYHRPDPSLAS